jgi:uncharacterized lipoprotein YajG
MASLQRTSVDWPYSLGHAPDHSRRLVRQSLVLLASAMLLPGCSTAVAVADAVGSAAVYSVKTVVNTVDAVTPDIVNDDDDD